MHQSSLSKLWDTLPVTVSMRKTQERALAGSVGRYGVK